MTAPATKTIHQNQNNQPCGVPTNGAAATLVAAASKLFLWYCSQSFPCMSLCWHHLRPKPKQPTVRHPQYHQHHHQWSCSNIGCCSSNIFPLMTFRGVPVHALRDGTSHQNHPPKPKQSTVRRPHEWSCSNIGCCSFNTFPLVTFPVLPVHAVRARTTYHQNQNNQPCGVPTSTSTTINGAPATSVASGSISFLWFRFRSLHYAPVHAVRAKPPTTNINH